MEGSEIAPENDPVLMEAARIAMLCNDALLEEAEAGTWTIQGDPTEGALVVLGRKAGLHEAVLARECPRVGTADPIFSGAEVTEQLAISKAFFDVMWSVTLEEMLTDTPLPEDSMDSNFRNIAARLTDESTSHASGMKSFKAVYLEEILGFFDVHGEDLQAVFAQMYEIFQPNARPLLAAELESHRRVLVNVFSNIFRFGKAGTSLPTAQIVAALHAVVRWQRNRAFQASDFYDFHHATVALPYCDVFLTERFLGTVLTRPPLALDAHFGTKVLWDEAAAADALLKCAS